MKFREMSRYEIFKKDTRKCGIIYAALWFFDMPYRFDNSKSRILRHISDAAFDWCEKRLKLYSRPVGKHFKPLEFVIYDPPLSKKSCRGSFKPCRKSDADHIHTVFE